MDIMLCFAYCAEGLAWDWINEKLYWTDYCQDEIEVYDPVSNYRRVLLTTGTSPYSIVVDPGTGYVHNNNIYDNYYCILL